MFEKDSLNEFTLKLSSGAPIPGGGGASALAASVAASLGSMVTEVTLSGGKSELNKHVLEDFSKRAENLRQSFLHLIDRDAEVFKPLSEAYRLPKDAPGRAEKLEICLRDAASAPMEMLKLCCETVELLEELKENCTGLIISDIATGAAILGGAMKGAACNVKINTKLMTDRAYATVLDSEVDSVLNEYSKRADDIFVNIYHIGR